MTLVMADCYPKFCQLKEPAIIYSDFYPLVNYYFLFLWQGISRMPM